MYDEKCVRRGEIYNIRLDNGSGSEQGVYRPGLIISNEAGNNTSPTVVVAYLTTKDHNIGIHYGPTKATGRPSFILCEQLATIDKRRLGYLMGQLTRDEMREVESRLDEALDLGYTDDGPLKEKEKECDALKVQLEELKLELAELKKKVDGHAHELMDRDIEIAINKRMYEKAVGIIAAMRAEPDLPDRPMPPMRPQRKDPPKENTPKENPPKLADINTASFSVLRGVGLPNTLVLTVINGRPYKTVEDLKNLPGMNSKLYGCIVGRICCVPVEVPVEVEEPSDKVNVNTASAVEIHEKTGLAMGACYAITGKRNREGKFGSLDELVIPGRLSEDNLAKYRDKMEV